VVHGRQNAKIQPEPESLVYLSKSKKPASYYVGENCGGEPCGQYKTWSIVWKRVIVATIQPVVPGCPARSFGLRGQGRANLVVLTHYRKRFICTRGSDEVSATLLRAVSGQGEGEVRESPAKPLASRIERQRATGAEINQW